MVKKKPNYFDEPFEPLGKLTAPTKKALSGKLDKEILSEALSGQVGRKIIRKQVAEGKRLEKNVESLHSFIFGK